MKSLQALVSRNIRSVLAANKASAGRKPARPDSIGSLASEAMIDKSLLAKALRGERRMNLEQIEAVAKALGVEPLALFRLS